MTDDAPTPAPETKTAKPAWLNGARAGGERSKNPRHAVPTARIVIRKAIRSPMR